MPWPLRVRICLRREVGQSRIEHGQGLLSCGDTANAMAGCFLDIGWHYQGAIPSLAVGPHQQTRLAALSDLIWIKESRVAFVTPLKRHTRT